MFKIKQLICVEPDNLELREVDEPKLGPNHALIKIERIGICGTDLHAYKGRQPFFTYPRVLGHELAGIVEAYNGNDQALAVGDQVTVMPYLHCGECKACKKGNTNCCENIRVLGVHSDGGMQEYLSVPKEHLLKVNDLSLDEAVICEPLAIGAHAIRRSNLSQADTITVIGAGPIGLGIILMAKELGVHVIVVDINQDRLDYCRDWLGVNDCIIASDNVEETISEITQGGMSDIVFDATGNKASMENAFSYISYGGKVVYVGLVKDHLSFYDPDFHKRETTLMGSRNATLEDFDYVYNLLKNSSVDLSKYITHRVSFDGLRESFANGSLTNDDVIKTIVDLT